MNTAREYLRMISRIQYPFSEVLTGIPYGNRDPTFHHLICEKPNVITSNIHTKFDAVPVFSSENLDMMSVIKRIGDTTVNYPPFFNLDGSRLLAISVKSWSNPMMHIYTTDAAEIRSKDWITMFDEIGDFFHSPYERIGIVILENDFKLRVTTMTDVGGKYADAWAKEISYLYSESGAVPMFWFMGDVLKSATVSPHRNMSIMQSGLFTKTVKDEEYSSVDPISSWAYLMMAENEGTLGAWLNDARR